MAKARLTTDGLIIDFSDSEVKDLMNAQDYSTAAAPIVGAAISLLGGGIIGAAAVAGIVGTIQIHKKEFSQANHGNGVEVTLPWWAIAFGTWGVLLMKPIPAPAHTPSPISMDWPTPTPSSPGSTVARNPNHLDVFWGTEGGAIGTTWWDQSSGWAAPFSISPPGVTRPSASVAVVARNPNHLDVFWAGQDGAIGTTWWDQSSGWAAPFSISPPNWAQPGSSVAVVARTSSNLNVFWIPPAGGILSTQWDPTSGWVHPFAVVTSVNMPQRKSSLAAMARTPNHLDLFWVTLESAIGTTWWDSAPGQGWGDHAPFTISPPNWAQPGSPMAAVARMSTHLDVFWVTSDDAISTTWWDISSGWAAPFTITPIHA